jgi:polyisoprenoid-binding protein YceI
MKRRLPLASLIALCTLLAAGPPAIVAQGQKPSTGARVRLEVAPGTKASFRVREQLAGFDLPNDAVGTTEAVSGSLVIAADGTIDPTVSKLSVDLTTLKSDQSMRDNYIRGRTLETEKFPRAEFVPRRAQGLPVPLSTSGKAAFQLIGDMTVHGVTREITWAVTGTLAADKVTGQATTTFPFSTFEMAIPKVARVLSLEDKIQLELDFALTRASVP